MMLRLLFSRASRLPLLCKIYVEAYDLEAELVIRRVDPAHGVEASVFVHMAMD